MLHHIALPAAVCVREPCSCCMQTQAGPGHIPLGAVQHCFTTGSSRQRQQQQFQGQVWHLHGHHQALLLATQALHQALKPRQSGSIWRLGGRARLTSRMKRSRPRSVRSAFTSTATVRSTPSRSQHLATHRAEIFCHSS